MGGDGGDGDDGGFGMPPKPVRHCHRHRLFPAVAGGGEQGASPAERESRGKVWHTLLACKV